jgi:hypothetical protein
MSSHRLDTCGEKTGTMALPTPHDERASRADVDAWLAAATALADLTDVEPRYTLPTKVEPWVAEFGRAAGLRSRQRSGDLPM